MPIDIAFAEIIKVLLNVSFVAALAPLVVTVTSLLKYFIPANVVSADVLAVIVQAVFWLLFLVAKNAGFENTFTELSTALDIILKALLPILIGQFATTFVYNKAVKFNVPIQGFKRS